METAKGGSLAGAAHAAADLAMAAGAAVLAGGAFAVAEGGAHVGRRGRWGGALGEAEGDEHEEGAGEKQWGHGWGRLRIEDWRMENGDCVGV